MQIFKKLTIFGCLKIIFLSNLLGQITIEQTDFAKIGENFIMGVTLISPKENFSVEKLGDSDWDFSKFKPHAFDTIRILHPKDTRYGQKFPNANFVYYHGRANMMYLNQEKGHIFKVGLIQDFLNLKAAVIINFQDSITQFEFPITYKTSYSDTSKKKVITPYYLVPWADSIRADMQIIEQSTFDAFGTLRTPMGEYQVLREKYVVKKFVLGYKFSLFGWTPASEYNQNSIQITYRWWTKNGGIPVAIAEVNNKGIITKIKYQFIEPMRLSFRARNINCKGHANGRIDLVIKGGVPDYVCEWSNGATTEDLRDLKAGTYTVKVTDNKKSTVTESFSLSEPLIELTSRIEKKDISCFGKKDAIAELIISGGDEPYIQKWSMDSLERKVTNLGAGIYSVLIQDKNYCVISDTVEIIAPDRALFVKAFPQHIRCKGSAEGEIYAEAMGGTPQYNYFWSNNMKGDTIRGVQAGGYTLTVTDAHGCSVIEKVFVKEPLENLVVKSTIKPVSCFGGEDGAVELEVKGGGGSYHYEWSTESTAQNIRNLIAGFYRYTVTDNLKCVIQDSVFVTQPNDSVRVSHQKKDISCFGANDGSAEIFASGGVGGYKFLWSNGNTKEKQNKLPAGFYKVTVTDKNNCLFKDTFSIVSPEKALIINGIQQPPKCKNSADGIIFTEVSGGTFPYKFKWSDRQISDSAINLKAGKYSVEVTDSHACSATKDFQLSEPELELVVNSKVLDISCNSANDGEIHLKISGGTPYYDCKWSNGFETTDIEGMKPGFYSVRITDKAGCEIAKNFEIKEAEKIVLDANIKQPTDNNADGEIDLLIKGGKAPYKINWYNGETNVKLINLSKGTYGVTVTDANSCETDNKFLLGN